MYDHNNVAFDLNNYSTNTVFQLFGIVLIYPET